MIVTTYESRSKPPRFYRVHQLDVPIAYKIAIATTLLFALFAAFVFREWLWDPSGFVGGFITGAQISLSIALMVIVTYALLFGVPISAVRAGRRGFNDEFIEIVSTHKRLLAMRSLLPEGAGIRARVDEYGRLAYNLFSECNRLPSHVSARGKEFYRLQNEIQVEAQRLIDSGNELVDLIASRRAENTLESVKMLGIKEYAEQVSIETMAHRALQAGDDHPKGRTFRDEWQRKPIPPRPQKRRVGGQTK